MNGERLRVGAFVPGRGEFELSGLSGDFLDEETSGMITECEDDFRRPRRVFEFVADETPLSGSVVMGPVVQPYHVTPYSEMVTRSGLLLSAWEERESNECGWQPSPNFAANPLISVYFPAEKINDLRVQGTELSLLTADGQPQFWIVALEPAAIEQLVLVRGYEDEFVAKREVAGSVATLRESNPDFGFVDPDRRYTGVGVEHFMAEIPVTPKLQEDMFGATVDVVFGLNRAELAARMFASFRDLNANCPFRFHNGHGDADGLRTLAVLWTETILRAYWRRFGVAVERMTELDGNYNSYEKTVVWKKMLAQVRGSSLELDWYTRFERQLAAGNVLSLDQLEEGVVERMFDENRVVELIGRLDAIDPESGVRYLASHDVSGFLPLVPEGMLAYWVDRHGVEVDPESRLLVWESFPQSVSEKEKVLIWAESRHWHESERRIHGRFVPKKSGRYGRSA